MVYTVCDHVFQQLVVTCFASAHMDRWNNLRWLNGIPSSKIDKWSGMEFVARDACLWRKVQLLVDFRYIQKRGAFWDGSNEKRRWNSRWGCTKPSYAFHVFVIRDSFITNGFPEVTLY